MVRYSNKVAKTQQAENQLFGIDFHDFIQKEQQANVYELATEFGLSYRDVSKLKKRMMRN